MAQPSAIVRWKRSTFPLVCGRYGRVRLGAIDKASNVCGNVPELLHADMHERARVVVLVSANRFARGAVDMGQPVQVRRSQDAVDRGRGDAETDASWTGPSPSRMRRLTHLFVTLLDILFGDDLGREGRSFMGSPAR